MNKLTPKQKMLRLAAYLEDHVPPSEFDMRFWKCGSVGCALGHAVTIFPDELCLIQKYRDFFEVGLKNRMTADGYDAATNLFNISREESRLLFNPYFFTSDNGLRLTKKTKDYVVNDLRNFANNKWPDEIVEEIIEKVPVGEIQNV